MVTQSDVAKRVGLEVSSVNKILNKRPGATFKTETVERVFAVAEELGYKFKPNSKFEIEAENVKLKEQVKKLKAQLSAIQKYKSA